MNLFAAALGGAFFAAQALAADLPPVEIKGSHFFLKDGTPFFIKGVAYQPDFKTNGVGNLPGVEPTNYIDPIADITSCTRDVPLLKELGVNTIRVYTVDPTKDHDACMKLLNDAGIYVIQDLSSPGHSINRNSPEWTTDLYKSYTAVLDAMAKYPNTLGFFAGNEVSNLRNNTNASAFVKAAVRDMKRYIKAKNYRAMGVGYATNDDAEIRVNLKDYFNCGDPADAIDFWGYNIYSWCGDSSFTKSGFDQRTLEFKQYSVPAFFAEYGCNAVKPRKFTEVEALYGPQMTDVWSGGIMYMYFQETNDYGLVEVKDGKLSKLVDFNNFKAQLTKVKPTFSSASSYTPSNKPATCPVANSDWLSNEKLPPAANAELCSCMTSSLECGVKDTLTGLEIGTLFATVCGLDGGKACAGVAANTTSGVYGAYSMCSGKEKINFALNAYYLNQKKAANACDFKGQAERKTPTATTGSCSGLLAAAGAAGTGVVAAANVAGSAAAGKTSTGLASKPTMAANAGLVSVGVGAAALAALLV